MRVIVTRIITKDGVENEYFVYNGKVTQRMYGISLMALRDRGIEILNAKIIDRAVYVDPLVPRTPDNIQITASMIQNELGDLLAKYYSNLLSTSQEKKVGVKK